MQSIATGRLPRLLQALGAIFARRRGRLSSERRGETAGRRETAFSSHLLQRQVRGGQQLARAGELRAGDIAHDR